MADKTPAPAKADPTPTATYEVPLDTQAAKVAAEQKAILTRHAGIIDDLQLRVKHLEGFLSRLHGHDVTKQHEAAPAAKPPAKSV
jgi:hypothetical protein